MPKLFCVSDIHSFYDEMKVALDEAGFDPNNEDHWLVSLGDALDRGPQTQEVIDYLMRLPKCVLIKGNHDILMEQCINRGYPQYYDHHNGTFRSVIDLAPNAKTFCEACTVAYAKAKPFWDKMVNYLETERFVFCHSWIPVHFNFSNAPYHLRNRKFSKNENWRHAHQSEWDTSMWVNPLEMAKNGFGIEKTIVCGHWHCSAGWAMQDGRSEFGDDAIFDPFYYEDKLIMVDACTAHSHKVNVLVVEDNFLENNT